MRAKNWRELPGKALCVSADWVATEGDRLRLFDVAEIVDAEIAKSLIYGDLKKMFKKNYFELTGDYAKDVG